MNSFYHNTGQVPTQDGDILSKYDYLGNRQQALGNGMKNETLDILKDIELTLAK